jgi:pimeloyl-ACP methyl ester carboxylesterase
MPALAFYRKTSQEIINRIVNETSHMNNITIFNDFKICDNFNTMDKTDSIKIPCLILVGESDKLTPLKYSKYFFEKIKNSKLVVIEGAGHMVMLEKPKEFNRAIEVYLKKNL